MRFEFGEGDIILLNVKVQQQGGFIVIVQQQDYSVNEHKHHPNPKTEQTIINKLGAFQQKKKKKLGASDTGERERNERDRVEILYFVQMNMLRFGVIT